MLKTSVEKALNNQINEEFFSSYLYLSMSAYFESINLQGFANWMKIQSQEEYIHAMKFFDYVNQMSGTVVLKAIKDPKTKWKSIAEVFEETYKHEGHITDLTNKLTTLSLKESDHATYSFLKWFVDEQVEEMANAGQLLHEVKMLGNNNAGILMLDRELKARTPVLVNTAAQAGA
jgi:ferritin